MFSPCVGLVSTCGCRGAASTSYWGNWPRHSSQQSTGSLPISSPSGPHTHPTGALQIRVGGARGLILDSGLSFDFLKSSMSSCHLLSYSVLPGDTNSNACTLESCCLCRSHFPPSPSIQNSVQNSNSTRTKDFYELGQFSAKLLHSVNL